MGNCSNSFAAERESRWFVGLREFNEKSAVNGKFLIFANILLNQIIVNLKKLGEKNKRHNLSITRMNNLNKKLEKICMCVNICVTFCRQFLENDCADFKNSKVIGSP